MQSQFVSKSLAILGLGAACLVGSAQATTFGPGAGGAIPDGVAPSGTAINLSTVGVFTSTITVATSGLITSFNSVTLTGLSHPQAGDLVITLSHGGRTVDLLDHVAASIPTNFGSTADLSGDYTFMIGGAAIVGNAGTITPGTYAPVANAAGGWSSATDLLSDFAGLDVQGAWTLTIRDLLRDDTGTLTSWAFDATLPTIAPPPPPPPPPSGSVPLPGSAALMLAGVLAAGLGRKRRVS